MKLSQLEIVRVGWLHALKCLANWSTASWQILPPLTNGQSRRHRLRAAQSRVDKPRLVSYLGRRLACGRPRTRSARASDCRIGTAFHLLLFPGPSVLVRRRRPDLLDVPGRPAETVLPFTASEVDGESIVDYLSVNLEAVPKSSSRSHRLNPGNRTEIGWNAGSGSIDPRNRFVRRCRTNCRSSVNGRQVCQFSRQCRSNMFCFR